MTWSSYAVFLNMVAVFSEGLVQMPSELMARRKQKGDIVDEGPWIAVEQNVDDDHRNLCSFDKQLPDVYVIGQQKCGTSSLAQDLMEAGVANVHGPSNDKEFHFFDAPSRLDFSLSGNEGIEANRAAWREWMPDCPGGETVAPRQVLGDFTPGYLAMFPVPDSFVTTGPWLKAYEVHANSPQKMKELYGEEAAAKLNLVIMLRSPLSQMQSAWYHAESFSFRNVCASCEAPSFRVALQRAIDGLRLNQINQWIWNVMYGRHIEEWLRHFEPMQFYLIPTNIYSKGDSTAICRDLSSRLAFNMACEPKSGDSETTHAWTHEHPSLEEDVAGMREQFETLMEAENARLLDVITDASGKGMGLANYEGPKGDRDAIKEWLEAGW